MLRKSLAEATEGFSDVVSAVIQRVFVVIPESRPKSPFQGVFQYPHPRPRPQSVIAKSLERHDFNFSTHLKLRYLMYFLLFAHGYELYDSWINWSCADYSWHQCGSSVHKTSQEGCRSFPEVMIVLAETQNLSPSI